MPGKNLNAKDLTSARRAPWGLLRPRHSPACSVAIRRPGPLLLLLPPVPARHPAGPPTPAEQGAGQEPWPVHAGPPGGSSGRATALLARGNPAPRAPAPAAAPRAGTAPGWPADAGRARGRARDLASARWAPWGLLRPRHSPACSVAIRRPGPLLLLLPPVPARHPAGPPTPAEQGAGQEPWPVHAGPPGGSSGRATALLARWQSGAQGPCSCCCPPCRHGTRLARRRRQSKGPGKRLGQCTLGPLGPPQGRATALLARWQSGAQGPCSCCCPPCRHGTRLARRRRQSKGPGKSLGQCTPGPLGAPQAAPQPCLLGGNPAPRAPAPAAAPRAGTAPGWPADAGRARGRARDLASARWAPWGPPQAAPQPCLLGGNPAPRAPAPAAAPRAGTAPGWPADAAAGPPTPAEQGAGQEPWPVHAGPPGGSSGRATAPACSVAIRRPGPLLLLLPPVPARHPAGPPTPAEQGAGQETWPVHAGPPGAS